MHINFYSIPPLISSLLVLGMRIVILVKKPAARLNRVFFFLCLVTTAWLLLYSVNYSLSRSDIIEIIFRLAYCSIALIAILFFHYVTVFLQLSWAKQWHKVNYVYATLLSVLILKTNFIVSGLNKFFWGYYPKAGICHPCFLLYFVGLLLFTLLLLIKEAKNPLNDKKKINQIKYQLLAFTIFALASFDFVPNYGIELYPFGYIPTIIFIGIIAYTVIKHQSMDIEIVIRRGLIYSLLVSIISVTYLLIIVIFERYFQSVMGYSTVIGSVVAAAVIALVVTPLKIKIQLLIDKILFKGSPDEISEQNEQLRREVAQTERFKAAAALANSVAHEIRNPLSAIKTFVDYFPDRKDDPAFLEKFKKIVPHEIERINDLAQQLLEFARPSPLQMTRVNISKILDDSLDLLTTQFKQHNIVISQSFPDHELTLNADTNKLKQVFLNLLLNAIDSMPNGGTLTVRIESAGPHIKISISDTGSGIAAKDLPHIFEPFFTTKHKGTGLGLAIVQGIIEEHGGKIFVKSEIGKGTSFIITLPCT